MRRVKQIGVDYALMGGPPIPWTEEVLRERMNRFKAGGLTICDPAHQSELERQRAKRRQRHEVEVEIRPLARYDQLIPA